LKYCKTNTESEFVGALVTSNVGQNIVALDPNSQNGQCQLYVTKINAEKTNTISVNLFGGNLIADLTKQFEKRISELVEKKVKAYQELRAEQSLDDQDQKKIERISKSITKLDQSLQNSKVSLHTLRTL
jgi:hypothetical protein